MDLRQSTASQEVPLGFFLDSTDGNTEEVGLTINASDILIWKTGATTLAAKNSGGATHISNGIYYCVLDATDTNTIGPLVLFIHVAGALSVRVECNVLDEAVYDVKYGTTAPATATNITAGTITTVTTVTNQLTAAAIATGVWTDTTAGDFTTALSVGKSVMNGVTLGTGLTVASVSGSVGSVTGAVGSVTGLTASNLDTTISSRMATYTQPTGFLAATFPSGTVANTTNITAGTITTATNVTTVNGLAANVITAAATATDFGAQMATAIWTDTVAEDFTTALSVGKSLMNGVTLGTGLTVARCTLTDTLTTYTGNTVQTGDSYAIVNSGTHGNAALKTLIDTLDNFVDTEIGAIITTLGTAGAGLTDLGGMSTTMKAQVEAEVDDALGGGTGTALTAIPWNAAWDAEVQSEVDDALIAKGLDHLVFTSVTGTDIADNSIIAYLASKSATADWDSYVNTTDALEANRDNIGTAGAGLTAADDAVITAIGALNNITAASVWAVGTRTLTAGTNIDGSTFTAIPWNVAWDAEVQSECTDALNAYDPPTNTEMEARTLVAAGYASPTNITAGTITTVTNLTNAPTSGDLTATMKTSVTTACTASTPTVSSVSGSVGSVAGNVTGSIGSLAAQAKADVNAEVLDVIAVDTTTQSTAVLSATPTIKDILRWLGTLSRNKRTQSTTTETLFADDGSTTIATSAKSDASSILTRSEWA